MDVSTVLIAIALAWLSIYVLTRSFRKKKNYPPAIPGCLPVLGNVLQLREMRPHYTFSKWAEKYGPIYRFKTGSITNVVITSAEIAREVLVTKYDSISKRRLPTAFEIMSHKKSMVAIADYGPEYIAHKRHYVTHLLGPIPQKANSPIRREATVRMINGMFEDMPTEGKVVNVRDVIRDALFDFALCQVYGFAPKEIDVPELGTLSRKHIFDILVHDLLAAATQIDWRNYWPMFSWVPNKGLEKRCQDLTRRRDLVSQELINLNKKKFSLKGPTGCYADHVFAEAELFSEKRILWEPVIESSDTTTITSEWIMYELAKEPKIQERLFQEIKSAAGLGNRMINEDDIPNLPLLSAIIKETLRIIINLWGVGVDRKAWSDPNVWDPDRILRDPSIDLGFKDFKIIPFGGGKRMCAGINQAMVTISLAICALVQHFEWSLPPAENEKAEKLRHGMATLTTHRATPLQAISKPRVEKILPIRCLYP